MELQHDEKKNYHSYYKKEPDDVQGFRWKCKSLEFDDEDRQNILYV